MKVGNYTITLTAKELLVDLLGRDYFGKEELEGDFILVTQKEEVEKITNMLASDIEDIKYISKHHTIAGYLQTNGHYYEFLHFNEEGNSSSGYIIYDYMADDNGVWVEKAKHRWAPQYEDYHGREVILKAKLIEQVFKLPCFVE